MAGRLLKKTHMLRCAQSSRVNVPPMYASARRFVARLASEIFLSSLPSGFQNCSPARVIDSQRVIFVISLEG
jgi:hypothetical protein